VLGWRLWCYSKDMNRLKQAFDTKEKLFWLGYWIISLSAIVAFFFRVVPMQAQHPERAYENSAIFVIPFLVLFVVLRVLSKFRDLNKFKQRLIIVYLICLFGAAVLFWPSRVDDAQVLLWLLLISFIAATLLVFGYSLVRIEESKKSFLMKFVLICILFSPALFVPADVWISSGIKFPHLCETQTINHPGVPIDYVCTPEMGLCGRGLPSAGEGWSDTKSICIWDLQAGLGLIFSTLFRFFYSSLIAIVITIKTGKSGDKSST